MGGMTGRSEQETSSADEAAAVPVTAEDLLASPVSGAAPPAGSGPAESGMATVPGQEGALGQAGAPMNTGQPAGGSSQL